MGSGARSGDFPADDLQSRADVRFVHGKGNTQTLVAVGPVVRIVAEEKVFAGDHDYAATFQVFVDLAGGLSGILQPEPEEKRALALVEGPRAVGGEKLVRRGQSKVAFAP